MSKTPTHVTHVTHVTPVLALAACAMLAAGCGSSNDSSAKSTPTKTATTTQAAKKSSSAAAGTLDATGGKASVTAKDFSFSAKTIDAKAGKLSVSLQNSGQAQHEFVVLKTSKAPSQLPVSGGKVSEADSVGEIEEVDSGKTGTHTFNLKPGHYVFVCNVPGHYMDGMRGAITVH